MWCVMVVNASVCVSVPYTAIQRVTNDGNSLLLEVISDDGVISHQQLKLASRLLANALYRCMTEKYYFYHCDTVGSNVMLQSNRDFKGTLASLFNENTEMGLFQPHCDIHVTYDCNAVLSLLLALWYQEWCN